MNRAAQIIVVMLALVGGALGVSRGAAQGPAEAGTAPYHLALLPAHAEELSAWAAAPHYTIAAALEVSPTAVTLTGQQWLTYTHPAPGLPLESLVLRLYPNLPSFGGELRVSHVRVDGEPVSPLLDATGSVLWIPLRQPLAPGATVRLALDFRTTVRAGQVALYGQFSYLDGVIALPHAYPALAVYQPGRGWWTETAHPQGDLVFSATAFYDVAISAPPALILAATGTRVDLRINPDGTLRHRFVAALVRDFALFGSADFVTQSAEQDGVILTAYYNPRLPVAAGSTATALQVAQNALRVFNMIFGPYPYAELDIVQTRTSVGGIEYPGLVVIASSAWGQGEALLEFLLVHEIAHQWWYGLVGSDPAQHPWLDEALAQYAVALYIREREGDQAYAAALQSFAEQHAAFLTAHRDQPIGLPVSAYPGLAYFYTVYQKGPLFYGALAERYGIAPLLAALRGYLAAHRYAIATPDDLRASLEAGLGLDLGAFFAEWVVPAPVG